MVRLRKGGGGMEWLTGEPTLEDVFSDPVVLAMMRRDRVDPRALRRLIDSVKARRTAGRVKPHPDGSRRRGAEELLDLALGQ
jgi:hypothetical protein